MNATRRLGAAVLLTLLVAGSVLLMRSSGGSAATTGVPAAQLQAEVGALVPGASAAIAPEAGDARSGGSQLLLSPAPEEVRREEANVFAYGDLSWRASMLAASLATEVPDLNGYRLVAPAAMKVEVPPAALGFLQGSLPASEAAEKLPSLGSVSEEKARRQLDLNLAALGKAVSDGALAASQVSVLPVGEDGGRFALAVELETKDWADLSRHLGDAIVGLQTGLVGGPGATVEGLSITVSEAGRPIVATLIASRAMAGTTITAPGVELPNLQVVDTDFANITGGPEVGASASGATTPPPPLPTQSRLRLSGPQNAVYSAPGRVTTPEFSSHLTPYYSPHLRPRLLVRPHDRASIIFTSPAKRVKVALQRPSQGEERAVRTAWLSAHPASEDGLRWVIQMPGSERLQPATTMEINATYAAGWGRYVAGVQPLRPSAK
jgi:hypothetical protein